MNFVVVIVITAVHNTRKAEQVIAVLMTLCLYWFNVVVIVGVILVK